LLSPHLFTIFAVLPLCYRLRSGAGTDTGDSDATDTGESDTTDSCKSDATDNGESDLYTNGEN
jgi:hypothetical protein